MRKLITADVFALARIIRASAMRSELIELMQHSGNDPEKVGIEAFLVIMESLSDKKAEASVYELIAAIAETSANEVESMPLNEFLDLLKEIATANDIGSFFASAFGINGRN